MTNPFQLGDAVVVASRPYVQEPFSNHREGRVTATAESAVRVRWCKTRLFGKKFQWVNLHDFLYQVQKTTDL